MKKIFCTLSVATLGTLALTLVTGADAQTLTIDETITGIEHNFRPQIQNRSGSVTDILIVDNSTPITADLSQYTTYSFHYTAPAGQQIVVSDPGNNYNASLWAYATIGTSNFSQDGNIALSFDNLQGAISGSTNSGASSSSVNGFYGNLRITDNSGPLSFTGFTLTFSNLNNVPSGVNSYSDKDMISNFRYSTTDTTDPSAFVSLQSIVAPVPEPAFYQMGALVALGGLSLLRRRSSSSR